MLSFERALGVLFNQNYSLKNFKTRKVLIKKLRITTEKIGVRKHIINILSIRRALIVLFVQK